MPAILAIDTTTSACSCALSLDGTITERFEIIPRQHAARLLPMIDALMGDCGVSFADLDAIAYGRGPGSFTGLRIAAGVAQGIAFGAALPVVPVSSLASMAIQAGSDGDLVFATLDAKIDEVYWGFYRVGKDSADLVGEEGLCKPEALPSRIPGNAKNAIGAGSGLEFLARMPAIYHDCLAKQVVACHPRASAIASLAAGHLSAGLIQAPEDVIPVYLRDKVTHQN